MILRALRKLEGFLPELKNEAIKDEDLEILFSTETPYNDLKVLENNDTRIISLNGNISGFQFKQDSKTPENIKNILETPVALDEDLKNVLVIGGGALTSSRIYAESLGMETDCVEIDKEVKKAGTKYFGADEIDNLTLNVSEGRSFLEKIDKKYSIILDDTTEYKLSSSLRSIGFFKECHRNTTEKGFLLVNLVEKPDSITKRHFRLAKKVNQVYEDVKIIKASEITGEKVNYYILGSKDQLNEDNIQMDSIKIIDENEFEKEADYFLNDYAVDCLTEVSILKEKLKKKLDSILENL